jgi:hypothetical protein
MCPADAVDGIVDGWQACGMQRHDEEQVPPELDPWFERYDDGRPPRTMARRFRPLILGAAALTLVAMVLLVTQAF